MPLQATSGAASYDAFGGGVAVLPKYIEDYFSTYLTTGTSSTLIVDNGIDLAGKGGLVWQKGRNSVVGATSNTLFDTARGVNQLLQTNSTSAQINAAGTLTSFNSNGFEIGSNNNLYISGQTGVNWVWAKAPKFFDVVTFTGTSSARTIAHNLGSVPGTIIVKCIDAAPYDWIVYHRSLGATKYAYLNTTAAADTFSGYWNNTEPTSTEFTVGTSGGVNGSGQTYVAYLFAHNAGGFGLTGTDNVISCGSFSVPPEGPSTAVTLGYEPQWLLVKQTNGSGNWIIFDTMRGWKVGTAATDANDEALWPNLSDAANPDSGGGFPTATGFVYPQAGGASASNYIYIAIRRGPMKVPTSGTSVFSPVAQTNTGSQPFPVTAGFPVDSAWFGQRNGWGVNFITSDRLRGATNLLLTTSTNSEATNNSTYGPSVSRLDSNTQFKDGMTNASEPDIYWMMRRAPSYFDEVCYTGTNSGGSSQTISHNLGVAPELLIFKKRSASSNWTVVMPAIGGNAVSLNLNDYGANSNIQFIDTFGTSSITTASGYDTLSENTSTYVAYLFATCAGVSKVGNYTGTGAALTVNCGFTSGARFVMIKRIDGTNIYRGWYVWDSARGITSGSDPYLLLNETSAETTGTNYVDSASSGFTLTTDSAGASGGALNASGGTYIFLAIA